MALLSNIMFNNANFVISLIAFEQTRVTSITRVSEKLSQNALSCFRCQVGKCEVNKSDKMKKLLNTFTTALSCMISYLCVWTADLTRI